VRSIAARDISHSTQGCFKRPPLQEQRGCFRSTCDERGYGANTFESAPRLDLRVQGGEAEAVETRLPASESPRTGFCQRKEPALQRTDWCGLARFRNTKHQRGTTHLPHEQRKRVDITLLGCFYSGSGRIGTYQFWSSSVEQYLCIHLRPGSVVLRGGE